MKKLLSTFLFTIVISLFMSIKVNAVPIVDAVWPKDGLYTYGKWGQAGEISADFGTSSKSTIREVFIDIGRNITFDSSNSITIKAHLESATGHGDSTPWLEISGSMYSSVRATPIATIKHTDYSDQTNIVYTIQGSSINNTFRYFDFFATMENDPRIFSLEFIINANDNQAPSLDLSLSPNSFTNKPVTIIATGSDNFGVSNIKTPNGNYISNSTTNYVVNTNGTYTFVATDTSGNSTTKSITVNNIDTNAPTLNLNQSIINTTNGNVIITANGSDTGTSGFKNIKLPDGSYVTSTTATYTATTNGTYTFIGYDNAGNSKSQSITINNIDKTAPSLTLAPSTTNATNGNVTITANGSDTGTSGFKNIKLPDGSFVTGSSSTYTVSANGTYTFVAYDNAGNSTTQAITISNIDKTPPIITIGTYNANPTNQNITVTASTNEGTLNATSHTFTANGSFDFIATDNAGNKTTKTVTITNIDKTLPVITTAIDNYDKAKHSLTMSATTNKGTLNATSHTFTADGSFDFIATDSLGNTATKRETVTGLANGTPSVVTTDITSGGSTSTASPITFTPSTINPTNSNVSVTINYPSYEVTKQYKIGTSGTWTNYTGAITLSINDTIYAKATDSNGVINQNIFVVNNIDKIAPIITIGSYNTSIINSDVIVTATTNEGTLNATSHTFTANGSFDFIATDSAGNKTTKTVTITNIDKTVPILTLTQNTTNPTNGSVTINANATDSESGVKQIKLPDGTYITGSTTNYTVSTNGTYSFVVYDNAGNSTTKSINVSNIDKIVPTLTLTPSTTNWTNGNIIITVNSSDTGGSGVKQIKLPNGTYVTGSNTNYTISTNGTYSFVVYDNAGNSTVQNITINNIDKTVPTLTLIPSTTTYTNGSVTITATGSDSSSGVNHITKPDGTTATGSSTTYTVSANGTYTFVATDNVGNSTTQSITISNIDTIAPTLSLSTSTTAYTNGSVTITATGSDSLSGVNYITKPDGTTATGSSTTYSVNANGTYTFKITDKAGNVSTQSIVISNIDNMAPNLILKPSIATWTNGTVTINATGSDDLSNIKNIKTPNGTFITGNTTNYTVSANGTYSFTIYDNAGNATIKSIYIDNIKTTGSNLSISQNTSSWTNQNITLNAIFSDNLNTIKTIETPDGIKTRVHNKSPKILVVDYNGTVGQYTIIGSRLQALGYNVTFDNTVTSLSQLSGYDIILADRYAWDISKGSLLNEAYSNGYRILSQGNDSGTNIEPITSTIGNTKSYKQQRTVLNEVTESIYTTNEGDMDSGNIITGIADDAVAWSTQSDYPNSMGIVYAHNQNNGKWIHVQPIMSGSTFDEFYMSAIDELMTGSKFNTTSFNQTYNISSNGTYTFKVSDFAGNITTKNITVSNIDKTAPTLSLSQNTTDYTSGNVTITAIASDGESGILQIQTPDGSWVNSSTATYTATANGTYNFNVKDKAGNITSKTITINNIDKTAPTLNLSQNTTVWTNSSIVITATGSDSGSGIKNIKLPSGTFVNSSTANYTVTENGTYTFIVYDNVGNYISQSITINNIDTTAPTAPTISNNQNWTNNSVLVIIANGIDNQSGVKETQYKLSGATQLDWTKYTGSITISNEGITTITSRTLDNLGQCSTESISQVKIDKTKPINNTIKIIAY